MARDEDVKIYVSEAPDASDVVSEGEKSAAEYIRHRDNGDLDKTRELGERLGKALSDYSAELSGRELSRQKLVLAAFIAHDELDARIGVQMLQKSAASAMDNWLEDNAPGVAEVVRDSAAFTMYILNDRRRGGRTPGQVLADICDREGDGELAAEGDRIAERFHGQFGGIISGYAFD